MTKAEAVREILAVQRGSGVRRDDVLQVIDRGDIAVHEWNEGRFTLGFEYGYILGLVSAFGITRADLSG